MKFELKWKALLKVKINILMCVFCLCFLSAVQLPTTTLQWGLSIVSYSCFRFLFRLKKSSRSVYYAFKKNRLIEILHNFIMIIQFFFYQSAKNGVFFFIDIYLYLLNVDLNVWKMEFIHHLTRLKRWKSGILISWNLKIA